jgi:hypothetical protein
MYRLLIAHMIATRKFAIVMETIYARVKTLYALKARIVIPLATANAIHVLIVSLHGSSYDFLKVGT